LGFFVSAVGRDATLTGRTAIWASLLPIAMQRPFLGRGFGGFWTTSTRTAFATHAHSGYLEVLLGLGFLGLLIVSIFLLSSCRKAQRELSNNCDWGMLWICYIIMVVVHSITEASIDNLTRPLTAIIVFITVSSARVFSPKQQI
jgi:exopolysaccharide production protein ExoQ